MNDDTRLPKDESRIITFALVGFLYLCFVAGVAMILFGPAEKVNDSRVNLMIIGPLLTVLGYLTGRRSASTDTQGGASVSAPGGTVYAPPSAPASVVPPAAAAQPGEIP